MRRIKIAGATLIFMALCCLWILVPSAPAEIVVGTVSDDYTIVAEDGTIYGVSLTPQGDEVVEQIGSKVKVAGNIFIQDDQSIIEVLSYEILEPGVETAPDDTPEDEAVKEEVIQYESPEGDEEKN